MAPGLRAPDVDAEGGGVWACSGLHPGRRPRQATLAQEPQLWGKQQSCTLTDRYIIIQILTGTVHEISRFVDCQESYIFPRGYIYNIIARENITILIFHPSRSISIILDGQNEWFNQNLMVLYGLSQSLVTRLGNLTALHTFYYDVLLLTTAYSAWAVRFFLGQFPNMELLLLLLSLYSVLNLLYFPGLSI